MRQLLWRCSILVLAAPPQLGAQFRPGVDLALTSRYVWHGLTRTTRPGMQAQAYVVRPAGSSYVAAGAGTDLEPFPARAGDLSDHAVDRWGPGEVDFWGEAATRFGDGDAALGVATAVDRPDLNRPGPLERFTTVEIYSRVRLTSLFLSPSVAAHWDVDRIQGLYLEPGVSVPLLGNPEGAPFWAAYISARAGFNLGQQPDPRRPNQRFYYADRGLTHVDLGLNFGLGGLTRLKSVDSHFDMHVQINRDARTKQHRRGGSLGGTTVRIGAILSWPSYSGRSE
jgi:hypothetical protein